MILSNLQIGALVACAGVSLSIGVGSVRAQDAASEAALATFQGGAITRADFEKVVASKLPYMRVALAASEEKKRALLEDMIDFELLLQEAQRRGYADSVSVQLAMREEAVRQLIEGPLVVAPESLSDLEVDAEYARRKSEFDRPAQRRARHVVLAKKEDANALIAEARKPGARASDVISRVAREKSLDEATKKQSGDLGRFLESGQRPNGEGTAVDPALARAVYSLKDEGDVVSKPIAVQGGFSVLTLLEKTDPQHIPPASAKLAVREKLAEQRSREAVDATAEQVGKTHPVEKFPDRHEWIALDPHATADMPQGFRAAPIDPTAPPVKAQPDGF